MRKKSEREEDKEKALKRVMEVAHTDGEDSFSRVKQESRLSSISLHHYSVASIRVLSDDCPNQLGGMRLVQLRVKCVFVNAMRERE